MIEIYRADDVLLSVGGYGPGGGVPRSMRRDYQIRAAMEWSVKREEQKIIMLTKLAHNCGALLIHQLVLYQPFRPPSLLDHGSQVSDLRKFAFDAYDAIDTFFGGGSWGDWFIVPFVADEDDMRQQFRLGVFAEEAGVIE